MILVDPKLLRNLGKTDLHGLLAPGAERAALRHIQHIDGRSLDGLKLFLRPGHAGNAVEQSLGIFVPRIVENLIRRAALADSAKGMLWSSPLVYSCLGL